MKHQGKRRTDSPADKRPRSGDMCKARQCRERVGKRREFRRDGTSLPRYFVSRSTVRINSTNPATIPSRIPAM